MKSKLSLGILGCSNHFIKRIALPVLSSNKINLQAIASRSIEKAKKTASLFHIPEYYDSYEKILANPSINIVYIPLPNHLHAEWIKKAADAGKHILIEKPIALNANEAKEAASHAQSKGVKIMETLMYRFHPQWKHVKNIIQTNEIGPVQYIHTSFSYHNKDLQNIRNILKMGGGALYDTGCYAISVPRFLLDEEPTRVIALIDRDSASGIDRHSSAILDFDKARATFTVSTQSASFQKVEIVCASGRITVELPFNAYPDVSMKLKVTMNIGTREIEFPPANQYGLMFDAFADAILNNQPIPTPIEDAINNMKVIDALFRSEQSQSWENI